MVWVMLASLDLWTFSPMQLDACPPSGIKQSQDWKGADWHALLVQVYLCTPGSEGPNQCGGHKGVRFAIMQFLPTLPVVHRDERGGGGTGASPVGLWHSLQVARKYVAHCVAWKSGVVPWPVMVLGTAGDWWYEWRQFKAKDLWPSQQFTLSSSSFHSTPHRSLLHMLSFMTHLLRQAAPQRRCTVLHFR